MSKEFFKESREASIIKGRIVAKYFPSWARIISNNTNQDIAYIDLFCGPGKYEDGTKSTPLLVLEEAITNDSIRGRLISIFTDKEDEYVENLNEEISKIHGIDKLRHKPFIKRIEVGEQIVEILKNSKLIPSFVFLDPCGYKGLSLELINSILKDWGCETLFFFNYNRINAGIHNDRVEDHIDKIFGRERAEKLRKYLSNIGSTYRREKAILMALIEALTEEYGKYVQHFCVKDKDKARTSHYLIFVTKNFTGFDIMREIMASQSSYFIEEVPSFEYNLRDERDLFTYPIKELKEGLLNDFKGKTLKVKDIYKEHCVGKNYIRRNYKKALRELYDSNKIKAYSDKKKAPRQDTMGDEINIEFPDKD